jgi:hypothetical protein
MKFLAGATTGAIGTTLANPVDVVRVRLQGESGVVNPLTGLYQTGLHKGTPQTYRSTLHAFSTIAREEGVIAGLWRGTSANILRGVLLSASQLATYDHTKHLLKEHSIMEEGVRLHFTGTSYGRGRRHPLHSLHAYNSYLPCCRVCAWGCTRSSLVYIWNSRANSYHACGHDEDPSDERSNAIQVSYSSLRVCICFLCAACAHPHRTNSVTFDWISSRHTAG